MIKIIPVQEKKQWDDIVKSFQHYDVCYLNGYANAYGRSGEGEPLLFYYEDGSTRGMNVVMKRDIAEAPFFKNKLEAGAWFDLSTPYGYGGFWIDGDQPELVEQEYEAYCSQKGYVCEFVRFHLFSNYAKVFHGEIEHRTHNIVCDLTQPLEKIKYDFEYKVRKNLKRAEDNGLTVELDTSGRRLTEFLNIYYGTMERNQARKSFYYSENFFKELQELKDNYIYLHVLLKDRVIATELILYGSENCYSFLGGTDSRYFELRPNDFLKYEIIKWAKERGLTHFVLGGGYGEDDGIYRFKKSFAPGGCYDYNIGKRIFNLNKYQELVEWRAEGGLPMNTSFFPPYRS